MIDFQINFNLAFFTASFIGPQLYIMKYFRSLISKFY